MSSVLFPVGPLPPRVYWVRRGVVLALPLILILIIAVACTGGGGKPSAGATTGGGSPTTTPTNSASSSSSSACAAGQLSATLGVSAPNGIYTTGQAPTFTATITNVSAVDCQLTTNPATEVWRVFSGAAQWFTTGPKSGCTTTSSPVTTTLAAGASHKLSIQWDGQRLGPGCTHGEQALPGTYVLRATLDVVKAQKVVFHFTKSTA